MSDGQWLAYCPRDRLLSLEALAATFTEEPDHSVRQESDLLLIHVHDPLSGNDADVTVAISTASHVKLEAEQIAAELVADVGSNLQAAREVLRQSDARYEIAYDARFAYETYNTLMLIASELVAACQAVVYDMTNNRLVA